MKKIFKVKVSSRENKYCPTELTFRELHTLKDWLYIAFLNGLDIAEIEQLEDEEEKEDEKENEEEDF